MDLSLFLTATAKTLPNTNGEKTTPAVLPLGIDSTASGLPYPFSGSDFSKFLLSKTLGEDTDLPVQKTSTEDVASEQTNLKIEEALSLLAAALEHYEETGEIDPSLSTEETDLAEAAKVIDLSKLIAQTQDGLSVSIKGDSLQSLNLSKDAKDILKKFLHGLPENAVVAFTAAPTDTSAFSGTEATLNKADLFEQILKNIVQKSSQNEMNVETFIATGLTPEKFTELLNSESISDEIIIVNVDLSEVSKEGGLPEDLLTLLNIAQKTAPEAAEITAVTVTLPATSLATAVTLNTGTLPKNTINTLPPESESGLPLDLKPTSGDGIDLKVEAGKIAAAGSDKPLATPVAGQNVPTGQNVPSQFSFGAFLSAFEGDNFLGLNPSNADWAPGTTLPSALSGTNLTSVITQAPHASASHPATQMIAAHLQKNATGPNGEQRQNWTLQLDPPELGRVEIKMSFAKDKMVKASILVEKPETYLMLQRDSQILERSLQGVGLDTEQGISFELANDSHDFNQNGGHDDHQSGAHGNGTSDGEDIEIIETTMNWYVDPETGVQRYNLVV